MSRWRETLCGSAIKAGLEVTLQPSPFGQKNPDVMSCGGTFLPRSLLLTVKKKKIPSLIYLPKTGCEVVVSDQDAEMVHYGGPVDPFDELMKEGIDNFLGSSDHKPLK